VVSNRVCWGLLLLLTMVQIDCARKQRQAATAQPPAIPVSEVVVRDVTDYVDFTGRTEAINLVDIRPRVTGYIVKIPFREGSEVKEGDLLFEIDPRPYQAQYDQAEGQLKLYEAQLKLAKVTLNRDKNIAKTPGAISQQQIDQDEVAVEEAEARLAAFKASLEVYKLNLEFTQVKSPITGHISRYYLTVGNLVNQDQTLLTTVVSQDPIYAYFDVDEPTVLRIRKAINEGKVEVYQEGNISVYMGLQGEEGFRHQGTLNFVNNQVNPATGSILVRGLFQNPAPATGGTRLLSPGMFVRVRLPIGHPYAAVLVIDRAIGSDQGLKFVYVVNKDHRLERRRVTTGALQPDGLRVISAGLDPQESIVVGGLQLVQEQMEIKPDRTPMPSLGHLEERTDDTIKAPADKPAEGGNDKAKANDLGEKANPGDQDEKANPESKAGKSKAD
jgi:membrane fusion protein, multidrug efflux system